DPLETFYRERSADVRDHYLRSHVLLGRSSDVASADKARDGKLRTPAAFAEEADMAMAPAPEAAPMAGDGDETAVAGGAAPIALRSDFSALASFTPSVVTDASGRASVPLKVPDNLTRYRIMAVAVEG